VFRHTIGFLILLLFCALAACSAPSSATTQPPAPALAEPTQFSAAPVAGQTVFKIIPGESTVSYEVGETFFEQNRFDTAVGVTPAVNGEIRLDPADPRSASINEITIDISRFTSDSPRRDGALRDRFLLSSQFPTAVFQPVSIEGLPNAYEAGRQIRFKVTGDLTVRETTLPVTFDVIAALQQGLLSGTATSTIKMSDFGIGPISMAVLRTEDDVKLTLKFVARP